MDQQTTTEIVKQNSSGTVKISVETYQDLLAKAAEKAPIIHNTVQKTQQMVATDNKVWGGIILSVGVGLSVLGTALHLLGRAQQRALDNELKA